MLLDEDARTEPVAAPADAPDLRRLLDRVAPAVVVVDESILGGGGSRELSALAGAGPRTAFIVVGMHEHPAYLARRRAAGAADYVRLDEAERLAGSVVSATGSSAPFTAGRRRTGSRALSVVPSPGSDSTVSVPLSSSTRSRIPSRPKPSARADGSKP